MKRWLIFLLLLLLSISFVYAKTSTGIQQMTTCGDGVKSASEQCDDGNFRNDDGCSATCILETTETQASNLGSKLENILQERGVLEESSSIDRTRLDRNFESEDYRISRNIDTNQCKPGEILIKGRCLDVEKDLDRYSRINEEERKQTLTLIKSGGFKENVFVRPSFLTRMRNAARSAVTSAKYTEICPDGSNPVNGKCELGAAPRRVELPNRPLIKCGDIITSSVKLTEADPVTYQNCLEDGLKIYNDNVELDCDGLTITGSWSEDDEYWYDGITAYGVNNVKIKNCNIKNFGNGIIFSNMKDGEVTYNNLLDNIIGFRFSGDSSNNKLEYNTFLARTSVSIYGRTVTDSNGNLIEKTVPKNNLIRRNYFEERLELGNFAEANIVVENDFFGKGGIFVDEEAINNIFCNDNENGNYYSPTIYTDRQIVGSCGKSNEPFTDYGRDKLEELSNKPLNCGDTLMFSKTLTTNDPITDDICKGTAIHIEDNEDIALDCNGLTIKGIGILSEDHDWIGDGISIFNSNRINIKNCNIQGFSNGIRLSDSTENKIENNKLEDNEERAITIRGNSISNIIQSNYVVGKGSIVIYPTSYNDEAGNLVERIIPKNNLIKENYLETMWDLELYGFVEANTIVENDFFGVGGIWVDGEAINNIFCDEENNGNYYSPTIYSDQQIIGSCGKSNEPFTDYGRDKLEELSNKPLNCGDTLMFSKTLTTNDPITDDICKGTAIHIEDNEDIALDCNGLTIKGIGILSEDHDWIGDGISIFNSNRINIKNCNIQGFSNGIRLSDSTENKIENNKLEDNEERAITIRGNSISNIIQSNYVVGKGSIVIYPTSYNDEAGNLVERIIPKNNLIKENYLETMWDLELYGFVEANTIVENDFFGVGGIWVDGEAINNIFCDEENNGNYYSPTIYSDQQIIGSCGKSNEPFTDYGRNKLEEWISQPIECGDTLLYSRTLTPDDPVTKRTCLEDGIIIGANDITLDCNGLDIKGHSTADEYTHFAIVIGDRKGVTIKNCNIKQFDRGIRLSKSHYNKIENVNLENDAGISLRESNNNIIQLNFFNNKFYHLAIDENSYDNSILMNDFFGDNNEWYFNILQGADTIKRDVNENIFCDPNTRDGKGNYFRGIINEDIPQTPCVRSTLPYTPKGQELHIAQGVQSFQEQSAEIASRTYLGDVPIKLQCGQTLSGSITLTEDSGPCDIGIEIDKDDITLDCGGHKIIGIGNNVGITLFNKNGVTIKNCYITNFATGIVISGSETNIYNDLDEIQSHSNNIINNNLVDNFDDIRIYNSDFNNLEYNSLSGTRNRAILVRNSNGNIISKNSFSMLGSENNLIFISEGSLLNKVTFNSFLKGTIGNQGLNTQYCEPNVASGRGNYIGSDVQISSSLGSCAFSKVRWGLDTDDDGIINYNDNCLMIKNLDQLDSDDNGVGDVCDSDNDGIDDALDNCPGHSNSNQEDIDFDGEGNACDWYDAFKSINEDGIDCGGDSGKSCLTCPFCNSYQIKPILLNCQNNCIDIIFVPREDLFNNLARFNDLVYQSIREVYFKIDNYVPDEKPDGTEFNLQIGTSYRDRFNFYNYDRGYIYRAPGTRDITYPEDYYDLASWADIVVTITDKEERSFARHNFFTTISAMKVHLHELGHALFKLKDLYEEQEIENVDENFYVDRVINTNTWLTKEECVDFANQNDLPTEINLLSFNRLGAEIEQLCNQFPTETTYNVDVIPIWRYYCRGGNDCVMNHGSRNNWGFSESLKIKYRLDNWYEYNNFDPISPSSLPSGAAVKDIRTNINGGKILDRVTPSRVSTKVTKAVVETKTNNPIQRRGMMTLIRVTKNDFQFIKNKVVTGYHSTKSTCYGKNCIKIEILSPVGGVLASLEKEDPRFQDDGGVSYADLEIYYELPYIRANADKLIITDMQNPSKTLTVDISQDFKTFCLSNPANLGCNRVKKTNLGTTAITGRFFEDIKSKLNWNFREK